MAPRVSASFPLDQFEASMPAATVTAEPDTEGANRTALSFEVIPPRDDADQEKVAELLETLESYHPDYIAVTSSHRSGWLEGTTKFIEQISTTTSMRPLAHLACTAGTADELVHSINRLVDAGVRGLLALRGDLPQGATSLPAGHLQYATDLVQLIRRLEHEQAARFAAGRLAVGVACYPNGHAESPNFDQDLDVLLAKQRLGADFAITQLFFDAGDYLRFAAQARLAGSRIPLIPGIMPMTSMARLERMAQLSGLTVPESVTAKLAQATDQHEAGMQLTAELAQTVLAGGAKSLHIYTHNSAEVTRELLDRIGIQPRVAS